MRRWRGAVCAWIRRFPPVSATDPAQWRGRQRTRSRTKPCPSCAFAGRKRCNRQGWARPRASKASPRRPPRPSPCAPRPGSWAQPGAVPRGKAPVAASFRPPARPLSPPDRPLQGPQSRSAAWAALSRTSAPGKPGRTRSGPEAAPSGPGTPAPGSSAPPMQTPKPARAAAKTARTPRPAAGISPPRRTTRPRSATYARPEGRAAAPIRRPDSSSRPPRMAFC